MMHFKKNIGHPALDHTHDQIELCYWKHFFHVPLR